MSFLTSAPPATVKIGGRDCAINTSFRVGMQFELDTLDDTLTAERLLTLYYGEQWPQPYDEAVKQAIWFYRCGREEEGDAKPTEKPGSELKASRRSYDFDIDADALYTSFRSAYGIDLLDEDLHWWAFRELMMGLPEDSPFKQRVYYRVGSTEGMSPKQKKAFEERRAKYALPDRGRIDRRLTLEERDAAMLRYVAMRFEEAYGKDAGS